MTWIAERERSAHFQVFDLALKPVVVPLHEKLPPFPPHEAVVNREPVRKTVRDRRGLLLGFIVPRIAQDPEGSGRGIYFRRHVRRVRSDLIGDRDVVAMDREAEFPLRFLGPRGVRHRRDTGQQGESAEASLHGHERRGPPVGIRAPQSRQIVEMTSR